MPNLQVKREILLRRRRMVGERNEERDSERPGRGLVKKRSADQGRFWALRLSGGIWGLAHA
jgi:hypothetical protein